MTNEEKAKAVQLRAEGMAYYKIATILGRSDSRVAAYLKSVGHQSTRFTWCAKSEARVAKLFLDGRTISKIRDITGIGHTTISHKLSELGVRPYEHTPRHEPKSAVRNEKGGWDSRTFLPYSEWRIWKQEQRRMGNVEV